MNHTHEISDFFFSPDYVIYYVSQEISSILNFSVLKNGPIIDGTGKNVLYGESLYMMF